ncbi:MAG: hypothetical protein Q7S86_03605 [bacterium]|nr:hypothetical protein [bacterium]
MKRLLTIDDLVTHILKDGLRVALGLERATLGEVGRLLEHTLAFPRRDLSKPRTHLENGGFITLVSVLVVSAVGLSIALSLLLLGLGSSRTGFALYQSAQARGLANACAEESLRLVKNSLLVLGTSTLTLPGGTCTYVITNTGGQNRAIATSGTVGTVIRKVNMSISQITPFIIITSWQEGG